MSATLYAHIQSLCNHHTKGKTNDTDIQFEISPARLVSKSVFDYCLHALYFNEYLSYIAELLCWDKVTSGHNHFYYLDDMILTMNPDGRQSCHIPKSLQEKYYVHMDLMTKRDDLTMTTDNILTDSLDTNVIGKLKNRKETVKSEETVTRFLPYKDESDSEDETDKGDSSSEDERMSLKSNLRLRVIRQVAINAHRFPPYDKYHHMERRAFRTYTNKDITIHFEILRPVECQKKFEELLLPKPESKFFIKIWIHNSKMLHKYLTYITEDGVYRELSF